MKYVIKWFLNILLALDFLLNALTFGDPEETVSSRIGKKMAKGKKCYICAGLCWILDKIDKRHCADAINIYEGHGSDDDDSLSEV
jgi:hypothetical protein